MSDPIQFPKHTVPIVGQPFTLKNFFVTVQIVCNCAGKEPILLVGPAIGTCPACRRQFQFQGLRTEQGQLQFMIALVANTAEHKPAPPAAS